MISNILSLKREHLFVSRAASALYLIAKCECLAGKKVLFPCNICYAAIFPFLYAGCIPVFCDTDLLTGNITLAEIQNSEGRSAVVAAHMYGEPIKDIAEIKKYCSAQGILLIEDCASAMGAEIDGIPCGSFGDYSIFSTGYSKTIDIGFGGIILSDRSLLAMSKAEQALPPKSASFEADEAFFGRMYRLIRNSPNQTLSSHIWEGFRENLRHLFLFRIDFEEAKKIKDSLGGLSDIIEQRRAENSLYSELLGDISWIKQYNRSAGSVPWRFCFFVGEELRTELIGFMLERSLPVSDWYPIVTDIFGSADKAAFPNTRIFEKQILNLPLMTGKDRIKQICGVIHEFDEREV